MTNVEVLAFIVVPAAGVAVAWGLVFFLQWQDRRDYPPAPDRR